MYATLLTLWPRLLKFVKDEDCNVRCRIGCYLSPPDAFMLSQMVQLPAEIKRNEGPWSLQTSSVLTGKRPVFFISVFAGCQGCLSLT